MELIRYPFKLTTKTKVTESFKKHIISKHGCAEVFQVVEKAFETINKLRDQLNFEQVQINDLKKCEDLESIIYKYLKYTQHLQKKFKFESWQEGRVNISFGWSDSFRKGEITTTSNLRVEMCSILYNLVVLLYYIGNEYMKQNSPEARKNALKKFRYALWAITELKRNLPSIFREFDKAHLDFTVPNIVVFENVLYGLSYACLYQNLEPQEQQIGIQHVAGLSGEANKHFQHALKITTEVCNDANSHFSKAFLLETKKYLYSNTVYYFSISAFKMAKYHENKVKIEPTVLHMGFAISYLLKSLNILQTAFKSGDNFMPQMKDKISILMNDIHSKYQELVQENTQKYNHPIANFQDLKATQLQDKAKVTFVIPPDLEKELPDEKQFRELLSPNTIQMLKQVKKAAEGNKQAVASSLQDLKETRNLQYQQNFVNGYLEMLYQSVYLKRKKEQSQLKEMKQYQMMVEEEEKRILPHTIQQKVDEIKKIGGEDEIKNLIAVLDENFMNSQALLRESLLKLKEEMKEDDEYKNLFKQEWNVQPSSDANVEYFKQIDELQENLRDAKQLDLESQQAFEELGFYFNMIKKGSEYIMSKIPLAKDQEFTQSFLEKIQELNKYDREVIELIRQAENEIPEITNCLQKIDMAKIIEECSERKFNKEKTILYILQPSQQISETLSTNIAIANSHIDSICKLAVFLNQQKMDSKAQDSIKEIEKLNHGFSKILELYSELQQGLEFYQALLDKSAEQDTSIQGFVSSRSCLRQKEANMIKNKERYGDAQQGGYITAQPFFEDGSFPMGESHYVAPKSFVAQSAEIEQ